MFFPCPNYLIWENMFSSAVSNGGYVYAVHSEDIIYVEINNHLLTFEIAISEKY